MRHHTDIGDDRSPAPRSNLNGPTPARNSSSIWVVLFSLALLTTPLSPLAAQVSDPEELARSFSSAIATGDYATAADLMHPDALAQLRQLVAPWIDRPEVAELKQMMGLAGRPIDEVGNEELFAAFIGFATEQSGLTEVLHSVEVEIVGHLMEDDVAHIVTRSHFDLEGVEFTSMEIISAKMWEGGWRALMKSELSAMVNMIGANFSEDVTSPSQ